MIPYSTQTIDNDDIEAVKEVLQSDYLTCGPAVKRFETEVATYTGSRFSVAVNSCTSALHLAMIALGVDSKCTVFVSAVSFVASANCARFLGADVSFVDVDKYTGNMNIDALEQMLIEAKKKNKLPKVVVAVHLSGRAVDLERLYKLKLEYGFYLLEDAAHALGATYRGSMIGSNKYSDITVLSFHPVKIITTAEGGMCLTNNERFYSIIKSYAAHGIVHDKDKLVNKNMPAYYYEMQELGFNYRLSDLQAALGISQLNKIDDFLSKRRAHAKAYPELLKHDLIKCPVPDSQGNESSWHLYQLIVLNDKRDYLFNALRDKGIFVQIHYLPIYRHPYYQSLKNYPPLEGAEYFFSHTISIPLYPNMTKVDQQMVSACILKLADEM
ncbi:MAG: UDP-4-amino-4,6-dideoxy-N-acetyl-beta-L-altrosamine transaminase [Succinivibrio sp.]|uniref:UDP-4-amino-4, 6-dideoxy-N-acetyl-beta-L-altrosamine transaminase n=1 Tax=Succinivibrio faecicola TaxID=2820300 RepID=A0ABS7DER6_9GAMM|nr:UDP-4-amino-4,6-dideoxy-N-acetyl-beta-L-altrosamine transaminase [Succinivibrio faecicola]MBW7569601.1 UDP-4-amino-4,6-dideoxy-N-acetyl-beta-L-altrosamine transaminase [Succinivibrio faecicola]MCI6938954.1 UDP-4-amino-4,6-dideoxy-N-acetyl-beta-L-altrosamine transaminase [Succinatimonas hippei]